MSLWMTIPQTVNGPAIAVFRNRFELAEDCTVAFDFSADERADLFLDGEWIADGPERDDSGRWHRESVRIRILAGSHRLTARVLMLGAQFTAFGQCSLWHGFFLDSPVFRREDWECRVLPGCEFAAPLDDFGAYARLRTGRDFPPDAADGTDGVWTPVRWREDERTLEDRSLPPMRRTPERGYRLYRKPGKIRVVFNRYVRVRAEYRLSGSGTVEIRWAEALPDGYHGKGDRALWRGRKFPGNADRFTVRGNFHWLDCFWHAGRYLELALEDGVRLESLQFTAIRYPYEDHWRAETSEPRLNEAYRLAWNTLEHCSWETFLDCPYYEQLQYCGDSRLELLVSLVTQRDTALVRKSIRGFADSARRYGVTLSRWPSRAPQLIPSFSLIFILMLHDYAMWRDPAEVLPYLPVAELNLAFFQRHASADGLPSFPGWDNWDIWRGEPLPGWNFLDWNPCWERGVPAGDAPLACLYVYAAERLEQLERLAGNVRTAEQLRELVRNASCAVVRKYRTPSGNLSDDSAHQHFSEHTQILSTLADSLPSRMPEIPGAIPAGISFSHYYLDAAYARRDAAQFENRLSQWFSFTGQHLDTLPETFEDPRSDCHAWSSHILFHHYASVLGIRPREFGAKSWNLDPLFLPVARASGTMPHPSGAITVEWERGASGITLRYAFPAGSRVYSGCRPLPNATGELHWPNEAQSAADTASTKGAPI